MKYGSVCSGIEAATLAWHELGWQPQWFCEFDKFPSAVLQHHWPNIPNLGDMTTIEKSEIFNDRSIDLLVGGTPCQSFSVAGLRKGLADDRGNLALKYCEVLLRKQPTWFVWENVAGVLSSNKGRDFACILSGFQECGYGFAYRVLDAQYFGMPQKRRRVFVVGYLGDWRPAAAVLFEQDSMQRVLAAPAQEEQDTCRTNHEGTEEESYAEAIAHCLQTTCDDYTRADNFNVVVQNGLPRKLTPLEGERASGLPDNHTHIKGNKPTPDKPRYKAIGNTMAKHVMRWLGERIDLVEEHLKEERRAAQ